MLFRVRPIVVRLYMSLNAFSLSLSLSLSLCFHQVFNHIHPTLGGEREEKEEGRGRSPRRQTDSLGGAEKARISMLSHTSFLPTSPSALPPPPPYTVHTHPKGRRKRRKKSLLMGGGDTRFQKEERKEGKERERGRVIKCH